MSTCTRPAFASRPRRLPACILLAAALTALAAFLGPRATADQPPGSQGKSIEQITEGIQKLRGLRFTKTVPVVVKTPQEATQMAIADFERKYSAHQLWLEGIVGAQLGLYPAGTDIKQETVRLLKREMAGFYDPHTRQMVMVEATTGKPGASPDADELVRKGDSQAEVVLAHELTHALQDQHFDLDHKLDALSDSDDGLLALKCVAEGDATLTAYGYVTGRMDDSALAALLLHLSQLPPVLAEQLKETPEAIATAIAFQYSQGAAFVARAFRRGGWPAVNDLYRNPPQSSRQIMEPELYFDHRAALAKIGIGGYSELLSGWRAADHNTLGALFIGAILKAHLAKDSRDLEVIHHWLGDRMEILEKGDAVAVIWIVVFDDAVSAVRFDKAYSAVLDKLPSEPPHRAETNANAVLVIVGPPARQFSELAPAIWKATTIKASGAFASQPAPEIASAGKGQ